MIINWINWFWNFYPMSESWIAKIKVVLRTERNMFVDSFVARGRGEPPDCCLIHWIEDMFYKVYGNQLKKRFKTSNESEEAPIKLLLDWLMIQWIFYVFIWIFKNRVYKDVSEMRKFIGVINCEVGLESLVIPLGILPRTNMSSRLRVIKTSERKSKHPSNEHDWEDNIHLPFVVSENGWLTSLSISIGKNGGLRPVAGFEILEVLMSKPWSTSIHIIHMFLFLLHC